MHFSILLILNIFGFIYCANYPENYVSRSVIPGVYGTQLNLKIYQSVEYIIEYSGNTDPHPVKITVESKLATIWEPLLISVQQQTMISSWQLPYIANPLKDPYVENSIAGHTLCPNNVTVQWAVFSEKVLNLNYSDEVKTTVANYVPINPVVTLKTPSRTTPLEFSITAEIREDFFTVIDQLYSANISTSMPVYFYHNFVAQNDTDDIDAVLITFNSPNMDCMLISIQNISCPVYDLETNIKFDSYWQTMTIKSATVITKRMYPLGFYIIMVLKQDNIECGAVDTNTKNEEKSVSFMITKTLSLKEHYNIAMNTIYICIGIFGVFFSLSMIRLIFKYKCKFFWLCSSTVKSNTYLWHVCIIILFYIVPVVHIVVTYLQFLHKTGNDDICYYNFLCAHPMGYIQDLNHVLSNCGYVTSGLLFILIVFIKQYIQFNQERELVKTGVSKSYGMFYALGIALIMEGVLSSGYHICPKSSNFQYDTCFMYVMIVLMIIHLYNVRHGGGPTDTKGYAVFGVLGSTTILNSLAFVLNEPLYFWILFSILQIAVCITLAYKLDKSLFKKLLSEGEVLDKLEKWKITAWVLGNIVNWILAGLGISKVIQGFGTYLLFVYIINAGMYLAYYIGMKLYHKEKIFIFTWILIILTAVTWGFALFYFKQNVIEWEKSPATSRISNKECLQFNYYDAHDIWHFLSAVALFFTYIVLLTIDKGEARKPRNCILEFHSF